MLNITISVALGVMSKSQSLDLETDSLGVKGKVVVKIIGMYF